MRTAKIVAVCTDGSAAGEASGLPSYPSADGPWPNPTRETSVQATTPTAHMLNRTKINRYSNCARVRLVGSEGLASLAESFDGNTTTGLRTRFDCVAFCISAPPLGVIV